jgi:hypothetical protein
MSDARDKENCFRIVEAGFPSTDVVLVGKPAFIFGPNRE